MRQTCHSLFNSRRRLRNTHRQLFLAVQHLPSVPFAVKLRLARKLKFLNAHIRKILARSKRISNKSFNLDSYDERSALRDFRFTTHEIKYYLVDFFDWGNRRSTARNRYKCDALLATCVVLRRLASPARWEDLVEQFGKHGPQLSEIFWEATEIMLAKRQHLITEWRADLMTSRAALYAQHISTVAPLDSCTGYIDCTKFITCRPGGHNLNQRSMYSGHKRVHCLKFQSITTPDGLMFHLFGPEDGRRHDSTLYSKSDMDDILEHGLLINGIRYCLFADAAYTLRAWMQVAFDRSVATPAQQGWNTDMSRSRTSVEWTYKDARQNWSAIDFRRKLKIFESPVALLFISSCLLWNVKVILNRSGGQVAAYMSNCPPPTWGEYVV